MIHLQRKSGESLSILHCVKMHDDVDAVYMEKNIIKKLSLAGVTKNQNTLERRFREEI